MKKALIVGCGLSGAVIARELAEDGYQVTILERRDHIGGNMYDYRDPYGILVHKYGPHTFHTEKAELYHYICRFSDWEEYRLTCGAEINGICTPTPFNYQTIDDFYPPEKAARLKQEIKKEFPGQSTATVVEVLESKNKLVRDYARFLFDNDYRLYTAKQWGVEPNEIDPAVLKRVPLRFNYDRGYFEDQFQVMPRVSFTSFFENLLSHPAIEIKLGVDALHFLEIQNGNLIYDHTAVDFPVVYTGPLDELFGSCYGQLPYRSLRFERVHEEIDSRQDMPVVAYPQAKDYIRIIEYKKLPIQDVKGTTYEIEYSLPYKTGKTQEPYYPVLTETSKKLYEKYASLALKVNLLFVCGRLGDFQYYNMDQALERALKTAQKIKMQKTKSSQE